MATLPDERALGERPVPQASGAVASYNVPGASNRGSILAGAGSQIAQAGDIIEETNLKYDRIAAEDAYNKLQAAGVDLAYNHENGFKNVKGVAAARNEFVTDYTTRFSEKTDAIAAGLANPKQKELFRERAPIAALTVRREILQHRAAETDAYAKSVFDNTREVELNNVAQNYENPLVKDAAVARINASIDAEGERTGMGGPDSDWAKVHKAAAADAVNVSRLQAWAATDPVGALAQFQQDKGELNAAHVGPMGHHLFEMAKPVMASQMLSADLRTTAGTQDEGVALARMAKNMDLKNFSIDLTTDKRNDSSNPAFDALTINQKLEVMHVAAILKAQGETQVKQDLSDNIKDAKASYLATGDFPNPPSEQVLVDAYGPDKGHRIAVDLAETQRLGKAIQEVGGLSPAEKQRTLQDLAPVPGDGFASAQERQATYAKAVDQSDKMIATDPSGYALSNSPIVKAAYGQLAATMNPGAKPQDVAFASAQYAKASYAEQRRLGVADPKILPQNMAEDIVAGFNRETGNGDNMATRIDAASKQWGNYWPDVYKQLATEFKGHLPDSFLIIPGLTSNAAKEEVARLDHIKLEDLKKQVPHPDVKSVEEAVQQSLKPWAESLLANQTNSNLYQAVTSAATKMALVRVQKGQSVSSSVDAATSSFIGSMDYSDVKSVNKYAIPKTENAVQVVAGVRNIMAALPLVKIGAPPYGDQTGMRKPEELAKEWAGIVSANPLWVTNSDQTGLNLYAVGKDGRQYPVNSPSGEQMHYTWEQLRSMAEGPAMASPGAPVDARLRSRLEDERKAARRKAELEQDRSFNTGKGRQ